MSAGRRVAAPWNPGMLYTTTAAEPQFHAALQGSTHAASQLPSPIALLPALADNS
jgi:hypothetical protein